jgi:hypothetical protein
MTPRSSAPTNEQIVRLLESLRAELAGFKKQQSQLERKLDRLLSRKTV